MIVEVRLYAGLHKHVPGLSFGETLKVDLPEEAVVQTLTRELGFSKKMKLYVLVNGQITTYNGPLLEGDLIDIFPPVGGG